MQIDFPTLNFTALLPQIIIVVTALLVLILDLIVPDKRALGWLSLVGVILAGVWGALLRTMPGFEPAFQTMALSDGYSLFFNQVFLLTAALSIFVALGYLGFNGLQRGEYYALLLLSTSGMMLMGAATDLIVVFLGLEIMSIALYVLAGFNREEPRSGEAAMKYFVLGAFASAFFLYGAALIYGATGSTNFSAIHDVLIIPRGASGAAGAPFSRDPMALVGLGLLLVGFAFKVAAVPFQWWTPDVYQGAPTSATAFMSVGAKAAGFAALGRVLMVAFNPAFTLDWQLALSILAAVTITAGNIAALAQKDVKRMMGYSSIAHAGYIMIGLAAGTAQGVSAMLFYLLVYTFTNIGAFAVIGMLERRGAAGNAFGDYAGLARRYGWLAAAMAIFMFSLTGLPPLAGFWGKFYVFRAAVDANLAWLAVVGVINSAVSAFYYLGVVVQMYMRDPEAEPAPVNLALATRVVLAIGVVVTVAVGLFPASLVDLAVSGLFG
ncbi:MAG: NADH-quinone oxidoreductase subunit N [Anaerolineae bacterium]